MVKHLLQRKKKALIIIVDQEVPVCLIILLVMKAIAMKIKVMPLVILMIEVVDFVERIRADQIMGKVLIISLVELCLDLPWTIQQETGMLLIEPRYLSVAMMIQMRRKIVVIQTVVRKTTATLSSQKAPMWVMVHFINIKIKWQSLV